jgi:hypothetical protein
LESLGVFTRIADIESLEDDEMTVTMKPAANVELRDTPEHNKKLLKRPIPKQFDGSNISKGRGKYSYQATVGVNDLRAIGLSHQDDAAIYPVVENGFLALRLVPGEAPHSMTVRMDTTGLIGVPNVLGSAADLDGHGITWSRRLDDFTREDIAFEQASPKQLERFAEFVGVSLPERDSDSSEDAYVESLLDALTSASWTEKDVEEFVLEEKGVLPGLTGELYGVTTCDLEELSYSDEEAEEGETTTIVHVGQDVEDESGTSRSQEHFKSYLRSDHVEELGWQAGDYIDIHLGRFGDDELGIRLDGGVRTQFIDVDDDGNLKLAPCVRKLYEMGNNQLNFYFPNGLAHALDVADKKVFWVVSGNTLVGQLNQSE